jgi:predicted phosphodiesterase
MSRATGIAGLGLILCFCSAPSASATVITFIVASDTHYGWQIPDTNNAVQIAAMNAIEGMAYPPEIGGFVEKPKAVLVSGDLTDHWSLDEWNLFVADYGLNGQDGVLRYPCFECSGNHDSDLMRELIALRHWRVTYPINWPPVKIFSLDERPTLSVTSWLSMQLGRVGPRTPVVLFQHFGFDEYSATWWTEEERQAYADAIEGYNIIAIFHGHFHKSFNYQWQGVDVFSAGSAKSQWTPDNAFLVVRITLDDDYVTELAVAAYEWTKDENGNWTGGKWGWVYTKSIPVAIEDRVARPDAIAIHNYPNPFADYTTIQLDMPEPGWANISIFDVAGREVETFFVGGYLGAMSHRVKWNGKNSSGIDVPSGTYFYTATTKLGETTGKMTLVR